VPAKFLETSAFDVLFAVGYQTVLRQRDGTFLFEMDRRPLFFRDDGPRQPIHIQAKIMELPQMDVGRNGPFVEHAQEMFGLRFNQWNRANSFERRLLDCPLPTLLGWAAFRFDDLVHGMLPGAFGDKRIAVPEVNAPG